MVFHTARFATEKVDFPPTLPLVISFAGITGMSNK